MVVKKVKKEDHYQKWELPVIRIESRELYNILRDIGDSASLDVTAETSSYRFESLDDILEHLELFEGEIEINIGDLQVSLSDRALGSGLSTPPGVSADQKAEIEIIAKRFIPRIAAHKARITAKRIRILISLLLSGAYSYFLLVPAVIATFETFSFPTLFVASLLIHFWGLNSILRKFIKDRGPVFYSADSSFWQRNRDKILIGVIMLIVGSILTHLLSIFTG